ncbi:hypothetical protein ACWKSP_26070 [Micromonosporaceae bacterium Da 78-11]
MHKIGNKSLVNEYGTTAMALITVASTRPGGYGDAVVVFGKPV